MKDNLINFFYSSRNFSWKKVLIPPGWIYNSRYRIVVPPRGGPLFSFKCCASGAKYFDQSELNISRGSNRKRRSLPTSDSQIWILRRAIDGCFRGRFVGLLLLIAFFCVCLLFVFCLLVLRMSFFIFFPFVCFFSFAFVCLLFVCLLFIILLSFLTCLLVSLLVIVFCCWGLILFTFALWFVFIFSWWFTVCLFDFVSLVFVFSSVLFWVCSHYLPFELSQVTSQWCYFYRNHV